MPSQQNYLNKYTIYIAINVSSIPTFLAFPLLVGVPSTLIVPEVTSIPNRVPSVPDVPLFLIVPEVPSVPTVPR